MEQQASAATNHTQTAPKPPLPRWAYGLVNPLIKAILSSPLHRLLSNDLMVLRFHGRKSGRQYSIPVGYLQQGNALFIFSHSAWRANLVNAAPVSVRLRGTLLHGTADHVQDSQAIIEVVRLFVARRGEAMARRMGLLAAGTTVDSPGLASGTFLIRIELKE